MFLLSAYRLTAYRLITKCLLLMRRRRRFRHAAHGCVAPYVDIIRGK